VLCRMIKSNLLSVKEWNFTLCFCSGSQQLNILLMLLMKYCMVHTCKWCILSMTVAVRALVAMYCCSCFPLCSVVLLKNLLNLEASWFNILFSLVIINVHIRTEFLVTKLKYEDCSDWIYFELFMVCVCERWMKYITCCYFDDYCVNMSVY
jgi:hypothetical protein